MRKRSRGGENFIPLMCTCSGVRGEERGGGESKTMRAQKRRRRGHGTEEEREEDGEGTRGEERK